jgi:hypothetical protein
MRAFPYVVIAALLCWLAPASAWAQLDCSPCSHSFGRVQIGTSSSYSIKLTNNGTREVRITSRSIQTPAFSLSDFSLPVTIMPGASVQLEILFTPSAKGYAGSNITLANTSPNSHLALHFGGNGLYPDDVELQMTPPKLVFGNVTVGSNTTLPATLTALNGAITITSDQSNSSEFAIVGLSLPVTIPAGGSIPVKIQFTPNQSGTASGKVGLMSTAQNSPTIEPLTGAGVAQNSYSVGLSWNASSGVVGYNIFRGGAKAGPFQQLNTAIDASTDYTDNAVAAGATYFYVTTAVNGQGQQSSYSTPVEVVIP